MRSAGELYHSFIAATSDRSELVGPVLTKRIATAINSMHKESLVTSVLDS